MYKVNLIKLFTFSLLQCLLLGAPIQAQDRSEELDRLIAFARLAGDIQYFSPTDMVNNMVLPDGWENIIWNGVRMSRITANERDFVDSLARYFRPIEPSLQLTYAGEKITTAPQRVEKELTVSRQHKGLQLYTGRTGAFKSIRTDRRSLIADANLSYFDFIRIRVPQGQAGKAYEIKLAYRSEHNRLLKCYVNDTFKEDMNLAASDSVYIQRDTIPQDADFYLIKLVFSESLGAFSLAHDGFIRIGGKKYSIKDLTVEEVPASIKGVEWRMIGNDQKLFDEVNEIGDTLRLQLTGQISAEFPLAVYATKEETYPLAPVSAVHYPYNKGLPKNLYFDTEIQNDLNLRLTNVILIWNVFRIAFVYNPFDEKSEIEFLRHTLNEVLEGKDLDDYDFTLRKMLHAYKDAHIFYYNKLQKGKYEFSAPITLIHLGDGFYVKKVHDESLDGRLKPGDRLIAIDGEPIEKRWKKQRYFATGSEANLINNAGVFGLLYGQSGSQVRLSFGDVDTKADKEITTVRNFRHPKKHLYTSFLERSDNRMLNDSTYYFNLSDNNLTDTLLRFIDDPTKHIIFDVRGYLTRDSEQKKLLNKLITDTVVQRNMLGYHILSPTNKKFVSGPQVYVPENKNPKAKFYFLMAESTQSAPETFLDVIKYWKVGTLIGKHTAGANGNINYQYLPGDISVTFSGIKVVNSDGTEHHRNGIPPDHEVGYTLDDVVQKRDPFIEKALEIIALHADKKL
ncbi:S41 family peptidase [Sphingobacterium faecale]|uniref:Tail specific protease domain-containing protein n=1 Tax=Sphingobacterium faecale TaxID=2803775 RepID=A0ABS1RAZ6_9SPHI|nr:S41 family peptidase [Sphingobacterium faecale]MBL1411520.1 hypothetical protein [Sphingobacterium faecale]